MITCFIIIGIAFILMIYYIFLKSKKYDAKELMIKIIVSLLFVTLALVASFKNENFGLMNVLIILGLVLGLIGDILLDLKYIDIERTSIYTYGGFIVFGIGHILYMTAIISSFYKQGGILYIIIAITIDLIASVLTILLERPLKLNYGKMKMICFGYALCLFGTFAFSLMLAIQNGFQITALNMIMIGSILFVISDLVLSGTYFGEGKERPIDFILNYSTYYAAQFIIALALLFI